MTPGKCGPAVNEAFRIEALTKTVGKPILLSAPFVHGLHEQPYDFRRLTSVGLVATLEDAGWRVDSLRPVGGPIVVALDGAVRWTDARWRRFCRLVTRQNSRGFRLLTAPSAMLQRMLAALTLAREMHLDPIDPMAPSPRLTLGYVVVATRGIREAAPSCSAVTAMPPANLPATS